MSVQLLRRHVTDRYGGLRPFGHYMWHALLGMGGLYPRLSLEKLGSFTRLVFVCKGNVCRSPYGEAKAIQLGMNAVSAGLDTTPGKPAQAQAILSARQRGIDLSQHKTQLYSAIPFTAEDLVLVMEPYQLGLARDGGAQSVTLTGLYASSSRPYIQDPYGKSAECFEHCYDNIDSALLRLQPLLTACKSR